MVSYWSLILLFLTVGANAASAPGRIIGGETTSIQKWPYIVQVESSPAGLTWGLECAATILNNRFVLSAAQCFSGIFSSVSRRRIRGGSARLGTGGVVIGVSRVLNHPNYRSSTNHADVAVVELSAGWSRSVTIQSVALVPQNYELPGDLPVTLVGWGATREGSILGQTSSTLREVTVQTVETELCAELYANQTSRVVDNTMLCTGTTEGGLDSCSSDEGGPVFYQDANDGIFLVGVISWRHSCGNADLPSVNTKVSSFTNWIVINALD